MHTPHTCVFCGTRNKPGTAKMGLLYWLKFDVHPVSPGHMLVIPNRHVNSLNELTIAEKAAWWESINEAIWIIENRGVDIKAAYESMLAAHAPEKTEAFLKRALEHPRIGTKPDAFNIGINLGSAAGQTVQHLHWHVIPRYAEDVADPRGGVRHVIPDLANYRT